MKNASNVRYILFVSVETKMISPHNEWYIGNVLVCAHLSSKLACGTFCLCSITQLFRRLVIVLIFSPCKCPNRALVTLRYHKITVDTRNTLVT